jgi:hypothetical protein
VIILSVGMQKAGSAWFFNITNDLLIAAGNQDIRVLRERFHLQRFMTKANCNIDPMKAYRLGVVSIPHWLGNTYAVKTHDSLTPFTRWMIERGFMKATYIFRDPRDVAVSAFEHGERIRKKGIHSQTGFDKLTSMEEAIRFAAGLLPIWESWEGCTDVLLVKYENLREDTMFEAERLADFLGLSIPEEGIRSVVDRYDSERIRKGRSPAKGHLHKGITGRWQSVMTPSQKALCEELFREYLPRMGYEDTR